LARVALVLDKHALTLNLVRLDLGPVRLGLVPDAATATGPPPGYKVGAWNAGAGGGARDPRGIRWSPVEQVKCGGARDPQGTRWSPVEQGKVGGGNARTRTRRHAPRTPCSYLWVPHARTGRHRDASARAAHDGPRGGRGGLQSPRPTARRPLARASPVACRTTDLVTAWSGPGRSRLRRELCRITRCVAAALAGTAASGAPIVGDDMACPGLDSWPFPC